jgi:hypothetical protein
MPRPQERPAVPSRPPAMAEFFTKLQSHEKMVMVAKMVEQKRDDEALCIHPT